MSDKDPLLDYADQTMIVVSFGDVYADRFDDQTIFEVEGDQPWDQRWLARRVQGRAIAMRQLRHTAASIMLDARLDIQDVQRRLGHSRPSVTLDVYKHLLPSREDAGTAAIDALIASSMRSSVG